MTLKESKNSSSKRPQNGGNGADIKKLIQKL